MTIYLIRLTIHDINEDQSLIKNALHSAGMMNYGLTRRVATPWIYTDPFSILDICQSILAGNKYSEAQLVTKRQLKGGSFRDHEL